MRLNRLFAATVALAAFAGCAFAGAASTTLEAGDTAPAFTLPGSDGREHSLEAFRGEKTVVLVFYRGAW